MDLIHRLNPFHHRPSSSLRQTQTPTPTFTSTLTPGSSAQARPSSSLEDPSIGSHPSIDSTLPPSIATYERMEQDQEKNQAHLDYHTHSHTHTYSKSHGYSYERYETPEYGTVLPLSPGKKANGRGGGHHRAPSILRSLAHHPSLSALKSKSKRKKRKDIPPLHSPFVLPSVKSTTNSSTSCDKDLMPLDHRDGRLSPLSQTSSTGRLRKKSLKGSKSLPRDMRLSSADECEDNIPPLPLLRTIPSPTPAITLDSSQIRTQTQTQTRARAYTYTPSQPASSSPQQGSRADFASSLVPLSGSLPKRTTSIRRKPPPSPTADLLLSSQTSASSSRAKGSQAASYMYQQGYSAAAEEMYGTTPAPGTVGHDFPTPESMRIKMRFEVDLASAGIELSPRVQEPRHHREEYGLGLGTPGRRRYLSFDERSPAHSSASARHLSSPASPESSPPRAQNQTQACQYPPSIAATTPNRPNLYAQSLYADSTTFFSQPTYPIPLHEAAGSPMLMNHSQTCSHTEWTEAEGLDLFVRGEGLPGGTPGGKKEDLRRGCFVDGAKHEKDAVRFFSRDMHEPASGTPSPESSTRSSEDRHAAVSSSSQPQVLTPTKLLNPSPARSITHRRAESSPAASPARKPTKGKDFIKAAKRSSSPFEVKLVPSVTKRMSLDAFGTTSPTPTKSDEGHESLEEVLENVWIDKTQSFEDEEESFPEAVHDEAENDRDDLSYDESHEERLEIQLDVEGLEAHQSHHLSTIEEVPSSGDITAGDLPSFSFNQQTPLSRPTNANANVNCETRFFTPLSPSLNAQELLSSSACSYSPSPLAQKKKHRSAPPSSDGTSQLVAQGITHSLLDIHAEHTKALKDQLKAGEVMMDVLRSEVEELRECLVMEREARVAAIARQNEADEEIRYLRRVSDDKDHALEQLRHAVIENEEFFDTLQEAHDHLASRVSGLRGENELLSKTRKEEADLIKQIQAQLQASHLANEDEREKHVLVVQAKKELESVVFEVRRELKWAEEMLREKECQIAKLTSESATTTACLTETVEQLNSLRKATEEKETKIQELEGEVTALRSENEAPLAVITEKLHATEKASREQQSEQSVSQHELQLLIETFERERQSFTAELKVTNEKDDIITYLRELLASEQSTTKVTQLSIHEKDATIHSLDSQTSALNAELKSAKSSLVDKEAEISSIREELSLVRYEKNERHFSTRVELNGLQQQVEELTRSGAEYEWAAREGREIMARLMEEKRVAEEERSELIEMLNRDSLDESSVPNLRSRIEELTESLASAQRNLASLELELDDARSAIAHKNTLIHVQDAELASLRLTVSSLDDSLSDARCALERHSKDSERVTTRLRAHVEELEVQLSSHDNALRSAVVEAESTKASSRDYTSRIQRYLTEIDDLKLSETKLKSKLDEAQKQSADGGLRLSELEKRIKGLEEDKELLNVALESKTMEVALFERRERRSITHSHGHGLGQVPATPSSTPSTSRVGARAGVGYSTGSRPMSMSKSTSRIPATPTPISGLDNTPLPRRLTTFTSSTLGRTNSTVRGTAHARGRRETISSTPTPAPTAIASQSQTHSRGTSFSGAGRVALGSINRHNRASSTQLETEVTVVTAEKSEAKSTPELDTRSSVAAKADVMVGTEGGATKRTTKKVERRSSLPVLKRPNSSLGLGASVTRRESLPSINED